MMMIHMLKGNRIMDRQCTLLLTKGNLSTQRIIKRNLEVSKILRKEFKVEVVQGLKMEFLQR